MTITAARDTSVPAGVPVPAVVPPTRLGPEVPAPLFGAPDRGRGLLVGVVITLIAALTRFWNLSHPTDKGTPVFDEKHYVPQGWQVLTGGNWIEDNPAYGLVVHPPIGKWMLAASEAAFGYGPLGWRVAPAISGVLIVVLVYCVVRRLTRSTLVGAIAGIFAICDGVLFVQSRMGMLDIFQALFIVAAFAALVADRDQVRERMYRVYLEGRIGDSPFGPRLGFRWYRFTAGVMLGLNCGTKWSGVYYVVFFTALAIGFDVAARRAYHVRRPWVGTLVRDVVPAGASLAVMPVVVYFLTYIPWFTSETAVYRYSEGNQIGTGGTFSWVPGAWRSLWYYESGILQFHSGLTNSAGNQHPWESKPWTWPMSLRPMLYALENGPDQCGGGECVRAQMLIGTPALWWLTLPMLLWGLWSWIVRRDWRYAAVVVGYCAGILPWFLALDRQMYFFYATALAPFLVMGLALCCGDLLRSTAATARARPERRVLSIIVVAVYVALVVTNFVWLWPILTASPISPGLWRQQIWLPSWG
ncbi:phospholipid carrier-dependent glycosyltransferase [Gordonia rubripertincta]|uniref:Polyprenol-phosphate-mannose--protein mannosyltransferase n=1 Tax=Gordonia rubripertincta TaxID=36822 RepID=A0AAW4G1J9_GORRU|nr:phospholipid carrier-dependent glycosyltransferase [Gordonia rubripertincta]MBM7277253.1 phospholipid carrier-dependent glycosyltransferase [Gordonia rubripertincta]